MKEMTFDNPPKKIITIPILEEYTKRNNIEYDFLLTSEYNLDIDSIFEDIDSIFEVNTKGESKFFIKRKSIFISMVDSNNNTLQFEEIDNDILYEKDAILIAIRLIRQQKLKELGI